MGKYQLNLVQLLYYPILAMFGIVGLGAWLTDLAVPEWEILLINPFLVQILGGVILGFIILLGVFVIFCLVKMFRLLTKFVSADKLELELERLKKKNKR